MKKRPIVFAVLLVGALIGCRIAQTKGVLRPIDQWFLDFLVANARDNFTRNLPAHSSEVVVVEFHEEDKADFDSWPPGPLDYIMALKRISPHDPEVLAFATPMHWGKEGKSPPFIPELRDRLLTVPAVVLGYDLNASPTLATKEEAEFFHSATPTLSRQESDQGPALHFQAVTGLPDKTVRAVGQLGFVGHEGVPIPETEAPMIASNGSRLAPSLAAQALTLLRRAPYAGQRVSFGPGARLSLMDRYIVPLNREGCLPLRAQPEVTKINALQLMSPDLGEEQDKKLGELLEGHKVVVFTTASEPYGLIQARALALALALPIVRRISSVGLWGVTTFTCLLGFWQLRYRRWGALSFGVLLVVGGLMLSMLVFSSSWFWWPPALPLAVTVFSTLFCFIAPHKPKVRPIGAAQVRIMIPPPLEADGEPERPLEETEPSEVEPPEV